MHGFHPRRKCASACSVSRYESTREVLSHACERKVAASQARAKPHGMHVKTLRHVYTQSLGPNKRVQARKTSQPIRKSARIKRTPENFLHKFFQELINRRIERYGVVVGDEVVALNEYQFRLGQTLVNKFCMIARNHVVSTYDN